MAEKKKKKPFLQRNIRANMASKLNTYINKLKYDDDYKKYSKGKLLDAIKSKVNTLRNTVVFKNRSEIMKRYNELVSQKYPRKSGESSEDYYDRIKGEGANNAFFKDCMRKAKEEYENSIKTKMKDVKSKRKHHDDVYRVALHFRWNGAKFYVNKSKGKIKPKTAFIKNSKKKSFQEYMKEAEDMKNNQKEKFDK